MSIQINRGPTFSYDNTRPTLYGGATTSCCPPLFDLTCSDGSIGVFHSGGEFALALQWFGLQRARYRREEVNYLQFMGAIRRQANDTSLPGVPDAICDPGDSTTFGKVCTDFKDCFGLIKIIGDPMVDGGNSLPYCQFSPRVFINGQTIVDDAAWHEANVTETMWATFVYNLLWGIKDNAANKMGHYGLWSLLQGYGDARDYVYPCDELKPKHLDWAGNEMCNATPMAGITLNGQALVAEFRTNLYSTLRSIFRALKRQMAKTRGITGMAFSYGDFALMGPAEAFDCLIQCAVCFTECNNNNQYMDTERAALALQQLRNGGEGYGEIVIDGFRIPLIPFDPELISEDSAGALTRTGTLRNADGTFNFMFLFRGVGTSRFLYPEFNPMDDSTRWPTRDNGMVQLYEETSDVCVKAGARMEWRWDKRGSMFQTLIQNVKCEQILPNNILGTLGVATTTC